MSNARKLQQRDAVCSRTPVTVLTRDLPDETRSAAYQLAADIALHNNVAVTIVGRTSHDDALLLCSDGCCISRPGVVVVVPDVEAISMWGEPPKSTRLERSDGRTAYLFAGRGPRR